MYFKRRDVIYQLKGHTEAAETGQMKPQIFKKPKQDCENFYRTNDPVSSINKMSQSVWGAGELD